MQVNDVVRSQSALHDGLGSGSGDIVAPVVASGASEVVPPSGAWWFSRGDVNWLWW